jgi:menaquinone-specific isochorismate synthase
MPPQRSASSLSLAEPRQVSRLQDWVDGSLSEALSEARRRGAAVFHVSTRSVDPGLPLGVFDSSIEDAHFFGGSDTSVLGVGVAKTVELASPKLADPLSTDDASGAVVMGGWGFPSSTRPREKGIWRDFPSSRWVVPALTLTSTQGETRLALAVQASPSSKDAQLRASYRRLARALEQRPKDCGRPGEEAAALPRLKAERSVPSERLWLSLAREAIDSISREELKKVVLSRAVSLTFAGKLPASVVLRRLVSLNPDSTAFAIKRRGSVFLGATPESLVSVRNGEVEVDCLAASSPRGCDREADDALGARLLKDPKSSREHEFVVQAAVSALSPISSRVEVPGAPVLKKLTTIQHLYTPVKATLLEGEDVWAAARALWPSPAIGGEPKEEAVRWIRKFERLDRGWYSGVVGLLNARLDEARLVVGIRSGLVRGRRAVVYAGAGLVAGSEATEELEETGWKLRTMKRALGVDADGGG